MPPSDSKLDSVSSIHARSAPPMPLNLLCGSRNYLASLVVVREEHAPRLPRYQRRVPIPLDDMDTSGTHLPQKSAFRNDDRQVMVRCLANPSASPASGTIADRSYASSTTVNSHRLVATDRSNSSSMMDQAYPTWQPHNLRPAPVVDPHATKKKMQRCTFGVPNVKPRESPQREGTSVPSGNCRECSKSKCACHDELYESDMYVGSLSRLRSLSPSSLLPQEGSDHASPPALRSKQHQPSMRKFLEPLKHVKSHNLFQKLLALPPKEDRAHRSSMFLEGSGSHEQLPTADAVATSGGPRVEPAIVNAADRSSTAISRESTVISFASGNRPPPSKFTMSMRRSAAKESDLNHSNRVLTELDAFENREVLRKEREEYLKSSNSVSLAAMRKARNS